MAEFRLFKQQTSVVIIKESLLVDHHTTQDSFGCHLRYKKYYVKDINKSKLRLVGCKVTQ